jgi:membrane protein
MFSIKHVTRLLRKVFSGFWDDELFTRAAALAFYSAFSFAPVLVLVLWAVSAIRPGLEQQLVQAMAAIVGSDGAEAARLVIHSAKDRPQLGHLLGMVGLGITLFSASAVFGQMQATLNRVWNVEPAPSNALTGWLLARARAIGVLVGVGFLVVMSFALTTLISLLVPSGSLGWLALENIVALFTLWLAFGAMYRFLVDARVAWRDAVRGGLLTALLFMGGKFLIALYIEKSKVGGAYGPASAIVVLLMWVYYASLIVLMGAEFSHGLAEERGETAAPEAHAKASS